MPQIVEDPAGDRSTAANVNTLYRDGVRAAEALLRPPGRATASSAMTQRMIRANGVDLWCETFGDAADPALLLIMGNSSQAILWPDAFCAALARAGRFVLRFDQRDTGLSTYVDFDAAPYDLHAMTADAVGLLDALGIPRADVVGLSQGGTLAYLMALRDPGRVRSVTAIMSSHDVSAKNDAFAGRSTLGAALPPPDPAFVAGVIALNTKAPASDAEAVTQLVENYRLAKGPLSPFDEPFWRALMTRFVERPKTRPDGKTAKVANHGNHSRAQAATAPLTLAELARIQAPTLILHGTHDPIFPPAHAEAAAGAIPGARLVRIEGMGHALDPAFFEPLVREILAHLDRSSPR